jgi:uncharacterized protein
MNERSELRNPNSEARKPKGGPVPPRLSHRSGRESNPAGARPAGRLAGLFLALAAAACLTGCFGFLKPARDVARRYVLTPLLAAGPVPVASGAPAVGVGQVKLPAYLFDTSLAVRSGTNEIQYLPMVLWAERLDTGVQRVLAANLAALLPTDKIRLSAWRHEDVAAEVHVALQQFDVDSSGRGVLVAWWRILSSGGGETLKAGESRFSRTGPSPEVSPSGAVATLSDLLADFSRQLAQALRETTPGARPTAGSTVN